MKSPFGNAKSVENTGTSLKDKVIPHFSVSTEKSYLFKGRLQIWVNPSWRAFYFFTNMDYNGWKRRLIRIGRLMICFTYGFDEERLKPYAFEEEEERF
jgi:hypothetical protein